MGRKRHKSRAQRRKKSKSENPRHAQLKRTIKFNPGLIGLENVVKTREEVPCVKDNGDMSGVPDLIFHLEGGEKVLVEVKSSDHPRALERLEGQIMKGYGYFKEYHNEEYTCIGVYLTSNGDIKFEQYIPL